MKAQPNILLLMPDQMRGDCLSQLGHPVVRTPVLDRLAQAGSLFQHAYSTVPSCIPARHAFLTGCFPQTTGNVGFQDQALDRPTVPAVLQARGYETALIGRNMHQLEGDAALGFQSVCSGSTYVSGDHYDRCLKQALKEEPHAGGIVELIEREGLSCNFWQSKPWPLEDGLHPTNWVVEASRKYLKSRTVSKPVFLTASFYAPHPPLFPPQSYFDSIAARALPQAPFGTWVDAEHLSVEGNEAGNRIHLQGEQLRRAQCGYYGLIEQLDAAMEELIEDFKKQSEQAGREWCIVFTSDHGEMLGDHGYFRKCEPYQGSTNIPLILAGSSGLGWSQGIEHAYPVCLEDILPTLATVAGDTTSHAVDGEDLSPLLAGTLPQKRRILHMEHSPCYSDAQAFHALTDGQLKYIWRPTSGAEQLFDLQADPNECVDLSTRAEHAGALAAWRAELIKRLSQRPEGFVVNGDLVKGARYEAIMEMSF